MVSGWYRGKISKILPDGTEIFVFSPEYYLAAKFEAHNDRGGNDLRQSHDFEDIVYILDNCTSILEDIRNAGGDVKNYIKGECDGLLENDGQTIGLDEIDPFTFFCYIYKYGEEKRLEQLRKITGFFDIQPLPEDTDGIPSAYAQKVWLFPFKRDRNNNEISRLWTFFKAAVNGQITNDLLADILKIKSTGKTKITEGLFNIDPEQYLPINSQSRPYH